jgi:chemotaxis protein CheC
MSALEPQQVVRLQALARSGGRAAADALRLLLAGFTVELTHTDAAGMPELLSRMGGSASSATGITFSVTGTPAGSVVLLLPGDSAPRLASLLLGREVGGALGHSGQSALEEAGNILASSYLTEIGRATKLDLVPSVPHLIRGRLDSILDLPLEMMGRDAAHVAGIEAGLAAHPAGPELILGHFLPRASVPALLASMS